MPNKRIIYVPWEQSEAGTIAQMAQTFLENARKAPLKRGKEPKAWRLVYFVPERDYLSALQMSDQIYVVGHGGKGYRSILTADKKDDRYISIMAKKTLGQEITPDDQRHLDAVDRPNIAQFYLVCNRLQANGLQKTFAGKIKFYNCWGALEFDGDPGPLSFAGRAARLLHERGFDQCKIFGYRSRVSNPIPDQQGQKCYNDFDNKEHELQKKQHELQKKEHKLQEHELQKRERELQDKESKDFWLLKASLVRIEFGKNGEVVKQDVERYYFEDEEPEPV